MIILILLGYYYFFNQDVNIIENNEPLKVININITSANPSEEYVKNGDEVTIQLEFNKYIDGLVEIMISNERVNYETYPSQNKINFT